jgi:hypothetical protein
MVTLYVFDISGFRIAQFCSARKTYALRKAIEFISHKKKSKCDYDRMVSTAKHQKCIYKTYYITAEPYFNVDLTKANHNPLRPDRLSPRFKIYNDLGGGLLRDSRTDKYGMQREYVLNSDRTEKWNDIFLLENKCLNPYYEN